MEFEDLYFKENNGGTERQTPQDPTHVWNLKKKKDKTTQFLKFEAEKFTTRA